MGHSVTWPKMLNIFSHHFNNSCSLFAKTRGELSGVETRAVVGINKIHTNGMMPEKNLIAFGRW
jgi:hypothetical protein